MAVKDPQFPNSDGISPMKSLVANSLQQTNKKKKTLETT